MEDKANLAATDIAQRVFVGFQKVLAVEQNLAVAHLGRRRGQKPQKRHHGDRLARAAFPDDTQKLARLEIETDIVDGMDFAAAHTKYSLKALDLQDGPTSIVHQILPVVVLFAVRVLPPAF